MLVMACFAVIWAGGELVPNPELEEWPPWGFAEQIDTAEATNNAIDSGATGPAELVLSVLLFVYQKGISPVNGKNCPMYPSCSSYAKEAISNRGVVLGILSAADRLHRCGHDLQLYEKVYVEGEYLRYDYPD